MKRVENRNRTAKIEAKYKPKSVKLKLWYTVQFYSKKRSVQHSQKPRLNTM